jgi:hypothetical protein
MADNTIIQQGSFTSTGVDEIIALRSDVDWVEVYNITTGAGNTQWDGVRWFWQRGMGNDEAFVEYHAAGSQALSMSIASTGFNGTVMRGITMIDSSDRTPGAAIAITAGTNATRPVYDTGNTGDLVTGSIVRIQNTAHTNLNGLDFSVDTIVANTSFRLANTLATAPGVVAGANGTWRYVAPNVATYNVWNPKKRVIGNITQAAAAVVTTLVDHGYATGQEVRIYVPATSGMSELNGQLVTVTRIDAATFSIDVDTTGYTAFNFPLPAIVPFTPAEVVPVGVDPASNNLFDDSVENTGYIGMILGTSATAGIAAGSPGGTANDVVYWRAGKSFNL